MADLILVLNAGSSSIKFRAFDAGPPEPELVLHGQVEGLSIGGKVSAATFSAKDAGGALIGERRWEPDAALGHQEATDHIGDFLRSHRADHRLVAVGHRVVHGGVQFTGAVRVTPTVIAALDRLTPLAPLHQPHNLAPIRTLVEARPDLPQVACFDTAFHRVQPEVAQAYALPDSITRLGVRRYGFHGLSYEYIASALPAYPELGAARAILVAHLGNGSSLCALENGKSVASTMGFTAVDGLPMGTRCGNLDPGVVLFLMDHLKMDARAIERLIYKESGLLGVSGISSDMRTLLDSDDARARFAVDLFVYRIGRELGSLAAATGGADALVFTAGIGEHSALIRERVCRAARWLGVELEPAANAAGGPRISTARSKVSAWVMPTNEELMIARHTRAVVRAAA
ncbi:MULTISPECIES: acetate/propionate family kinase [Massilia]|uniref:Acetate kinase n=1 Tax=Massilia aurea TaxID=373040 RepID=A0A422QQM6_9BURK|nr:MULTISPECIES: acetate/propionate family kinase [Massilia]MDY0960522.1 acetate/propionate family kinase [Massilia sp. CFBP9026]RNF32122.1 acetate kinase [Massilia aurea]